MIKKSKYNAVDIILQTSLANLKREIKPNSHRIGSSVANDDLSNRISVRELHKYVMGLIGIFLLFSITYPIAIFRVSHQSKINLDRVDASSSKLLSIQH